METTAKQVNMAAVMVHSYDEYKSKYQKAIILIRDDDFYWTFRKDAEVVAKECGILLNRNNIGSDNIEFAGFQQRKLDIYLPKLVRNGHRIAICDVEVQPAERKRITERYC